MKLYSFLRRFIFFVVLPYVVYLAIEECPGAKSPISTWVCYPQNEVFVPLWNSVSTHVSAADERFLISQRVSGFTGPVFSPLSDVVSENWALLDAKYSLSYRTSTTKAILKHWEAVGRREVISNVMPHVSWAWAKFWSWYTGSIGPIVEYYCSQYATSLERAVDASTSMVRLQSYLLWSWTKNACTQSYTLYVGPVLKKVTSSVWSYTGAPLLKLPPLQKLVAILSRFQTSASNSIASQEKADFVFSEIASLMQMNKSLGLGVSEQKTRLSQVQDILDHVNESDYQEPEKGNSKKAQNEVSKEEVPEKGIHEEISDFEESDGEVLTLTSTLTRTVTLDSVHSSSSQTVESIADLELQNPDSVVTVQSSESQLQEELSYWKKRVSNFLNLTLSSLEDEFSPYLDPKLAELTQKISANFTALQQSNYLEYKTMNELIALIDKDSENIRTSGNSIEHPQVDRQAMRTHIEQCYNETETQMSIVEGHLNAGHAEVMSKYFEVAQATVDILESFADTVISDFSNRLTGLLQVLQTHAGYDDKHSWAAWKEFHAVKESIFKMRDQIFDEAEAYRLNPRGTVPQGLSKWAEFIKKMNFHVIFLLKDNDEYMKLMRAKANVAYQQREFLNKQASEQREKERQEREEREKREREERERQEKEEREKDERIEREKREVLELQEIIIKEYEMGYGTGDLESDEAKDMESDEVKNLSDGVEDMEFDEIKDMESNEIEGLESDEVVDLESEEVENLESNKVKDLESDEVTNSESYEVEDLESDEVKNLKSNEVEVLENDERKESGEFKEAGELQEADESREYIAEA